jgi:hypothetical protein
MLSNKSGASDPSRIVSAAAVLVLHAGFLMLFLIVSQVRMSIGGRLQEIELRIPPPPNFPATRIAPGLQPKFLSPATPVLPAFPGQLLAPPVQSTLPTPGAISGVGRALFGCDPQKLDLLSAKDRAACLRLARGAQRQQSVRLGPPPDPNSPFTKEIEERFRDAAPINQPCPQGSFNDVHGIPCFAFDQDAPLLPRR